MTIDYRSDCAILPRNGNVAGAENVARESEVYFVF
jgi:hypothetical protein